MFTELLAKYQEVFDWSYKDIPRINKYIYEYQISTYLEEKPIEQKKRYLRAKWKKKIAQKFKEFIEVDFGHKRFL